MFDIPIANLDAGSYLRMTPEKTLEKAEKDGLLCGRNNQSGGLSRTEEVSRNTQIQYEAGIPRNVWLCAGKDFNTNSEFQQPAPCWP